MESIERSICVRIAVFVGIFVEFPPRVAVQNFATLNDAAITKLLQIDRDDVMFYHFIH
jgi:hypothetical protein